MKLGTNTASPGPIFQARSGISSASVPLAQASACLAPAKVASAFSKLVTSGPMMKPQVESTRRDGGVDLRADLVALGVRGR